MPIVQNGARNPLAVRLPLDDLEWLRAQRTATGQPVNQIIVRAVAQYRRRIEAANQRKAHRGDLD